MKRKTVEYGKKKKTIKHVQATGGAGKQLGTPIALTPNIVGRHNDMPNYIKFEVLNVSLFGPQQSIQLLKPLQVEEAPRANL